MVFYKFLSKLWALALVVVPLFGLPAAASKLHPHAEKLKAAGNPRLAITRYAGHENFNSQQSLVWQRRGDKYFATNVLSSAQRLGCESYLYTQQKFPLFKMVQTSSLTATQVPSYLRLGETNRPEQVNFLQAARDVLRSEAQDMFGNDLEHRIVHLLEDHASPYVPIVTATMWSVGGQALDVRTGNFAILPLPWQRDPNRQKLARDFDRKKYKLVWELGRTAQDLPKEAEPLAAAAVGIIYQELMAMGGDLEDAYVMLHSLSEVTTIAYSKRFPNRLYPEGWTDKNDALFLIPLSEALKAFPPKEFSGRIHQLIELSDGKWDELKALEFLQRFHRIQFAQLDVQTVAQPGLLALRDLSLGAAYRRSRLVREYGLVESQELTNFLMNMHAVLPTWNSGQYADVADMEVTEYFYAQNNALEISNLNLQALRWDPFYIERTLITVFAYYLKALLPGPYEPEKVKQMVQELRAQKINFGVSTFEPEIAARVQSLRPTAQQRFTYDRPADFEVRQLEHVEWMTKGYIQAHRAFLFSIDQILALIQAHPQIYAQSLNAAREETWARHLMLSQPDVF